MSRQLVSRNHDLQRLQDEGYHLEIRNDHLVLRVPYVTTAQQVAHGLLVSELTLEGDKTVANPNHVAFFVGADPSDLPCDDQGQPLRSLMNQDTPIDRGGGLVASCSFSHKPQPPEPTYPDYYEKMSTYAAMLLGYAQLIDPSATATPFPPIPTDDSDDSPFRYFDALTSRTGIGAAADRIRGQKIVIVGAGGTASYILDAVAKAPVDSIHLYDRDWLLTHNAFRTPGAVPFETLQSVPKKVIHLQAQYDVLHKRVIAHPEHVTAANIEELRDASFVFVAIDAGPGKRFIVEKLIEFGLPFVDAGMGVYQTPLGIGGLIRTTASDAAHRDHLADRLSYASEEDDDYDQNIQIAELNMLNAALAVIRWKKYFGFYADFDHEYSSTYTLDGNHLLNEEHSA